MSVGTNNYFKSKELYYDIIAQSPKIPPTQPPRKDAERRSEEGSPGLSECLSAFAAQGKYQSGSQLNTKLEQEVPLYKGGEEFLIMKV